MHGVSEILNTAFGWLLSPLRLFSPWVGLAVVSLLASLIVLAVFRAVSDQRQIRQRKDRMIARLLELLLFRHDPVVSLGALGRVLAANGAYLAPMMKPLALSLPLVVVIMAQVTLWFGMRPLRPGESVVVAVRLPDSVPVMEQTLALDCSANLRLTAPVVRVPSEHAAYWEVAVSGVGAGWVDVGVNGRAFRKSVPVDSHLAPAPAARQRGGFWGPWLNPGEPPLPSDASPLEIRLHHPAAVLRIGRTPVNGIAAFLVLTLAFAWGMKKPFGVAV